MAETNSQERKELAVAARNARHAIADLVREAREVDLDGKIISALGNVAAVVDAVESQIKSGPPAGAEVTAVAVEPVPEPMAEDIPPELAGLLGGAGPGPAAPTGPPPSPLEEMRAAFPTGAGPEEPLPPGA
jgi:hypothetical protein